MNNVFFNAREGRELVVGALDFYRSNGGARKRRKKYPPYGVSQRGAVARVERADFDNRFVIIFFYNLWRCGKRNLHNFYLE